VLEALAKCLGNDVVAGTISLSADQGRLRAAFYELKVVTSEQYNEQGVCELEIRLPKSDFDRVVAAQQLNSEKLLATQPLKVC
jgi:GTP-binding protein HflX